MTLPPLFIIGAGRSGTNILRDTLTSIPGWVTWNCDEINPIWRHGNLHMKHDAFTANNATKYVSDYIEKRFAGLLKRKNGNLVVEKTCANSLRVLFLDAIFPDARYVYIVRDGRDVALSAAKRWTASIELGYLLKKVRYVPLSDVPYYGARFFYNRINQFRSQDRRQAAWGPVFEDMDEWVNSKPLIEVCAKQWATCVAASDMAFSGMCEDKVIRIRYEELVASPEETISRIAMWYNASNALEYLDTLDVTNIHAGSVNGWKDSMHLFTPNSLELMQKLLIEHGYETTA